LPHRTLQHGLAMLASCVRKKFTELRKLITEEAPKVASSCSAAWLDAARNVRSEKIYRTSENNYR